MISDYKKQWQFLKKNLQSNNLSHAFLFSGQENDKIRSFTKEFIKLINCSDKNQPCGKCQNCQMIDKGAFPDLISVRSSDSKSSLQNEKDMMEISIEQVRSVQNFLGYKSYYGQFKAVIIENAERMSIQAQHSFLKTLEEPKGRTIIFLLVSNPDLMLPTILSRCQQMKFFEVNEHDLTPEENAILKDLERIIDSDLAEKFNYAKDINLDGGRLEIVLKVLEIHFRQMLLLKIGVKTGKQEPKKSFSVEQIKKILALIEKLSYQCRVANINKKMALEILLLEI